MEFYGRKEELEELERLKGKRTSSLVCLMGRRRIGKSTLIEQFSKKFKKFIYIQGLGPEASSNNEKQLDNFSEVLSIQLNSRKEHFTDWTQAFTYLSKASEIGETLILLDEISWMGRHDSLFCSKLKSVWDQSFKKNSKLILVLCGSVSSWIEENILNNASFEGRVSLAINLEELRIHEISKFWTSRNFHLSSLEKMLILSITGGVPKYLEEVLKSENAERNIVNLCFKPSGMLFNEFENIFSNIFDRKADNLEKIIRLCLTTKLSPSELATKMGKSVDSHLSKSLKILELSGFLSRDFYFKPGGVASNQSHLRVKDNYLRFYLKHIEPNKQRILKGGVKIQSLSELSNFESTMGYQFENLVLRNRESFYHLLDIDNRRIVSASPFTQRSKTKGYCQIDLLIQSDLDVFYLCELKCKKFITKSVISEVKRKMETISLPRRSALKPVLIYHGDVRPDDEEDLRAFFYRMISFEELC
ncbi:MAG TPA: ATP-binding protein [Oligoflexia bacterium]|nr:ATP-binding protein [Oligoflexia bacterium]HMP48887.1 ATP-binding protein [Oligoflexia bacterium]